MHQWDGAYKRVWELFEAMNQIPRCSGDEKRISDWLMVFGEKNGLEAIQEPCGNIILKKPASKGYEGSPAVILQGHMDMVCVRAEDSQHDFSKDPVQLKVDGDFLTAAETSLGADNGIAVAMALAILEDQNLEHPTLEVLITVAEETGMDGAVRLNPAHLSGQALINLDSEEEGVILASCAGGVRASVHLPIEWEVPVQDGQGARLTITGLKGGHSGVEIDKGRANAIVLLGRVMRDLLGMGVQISQIQGGEKMNAIANKATARLSFKRDWLEEVQKTVLAWESRFRNEFELADPELKLVLSLEDTSDPIQNVFSLETAENAAALLRLLPNGVQTMSAGIPGLVESSNNIGVLTTGAEYIEIDSAIRSSVRSLKAEIIDRMLIVCTLTEAELRLQSDYPEWAYAPKSQMRDTMMAVYRELYGKEMTVSAIHAGLECGILKEKLGPIDFVSIGANLSDVHTPKERLDMASTERVYEFVVEVLKKYGREH
ncbi:aminoacyl-histidine dipeptidase [Acidaminobacter sp.]|uniref:aminoacyl-histidine dipeptidase n=1 Tax=Acidaminobacter sp. TaxID=1872102 RepID=UPI001386500E|nr:aminoacyl-histidine dipeptidase [Acidaminobacter sp.]MDK9710523.1 aminoacyl-histidine dipeptidase [Acidaminobacter sp.]MZQ98177.1 beta-Ala-His dipeptidase [Acidaminobacter sp.]